MTESLNPCLAVTRDEPLATPRPRSWDGRVVPSGTVRIGGVGTRLTFEDIHDGVALEEEHSDA